MNFVWKKPNGSEIEIDDPNVIKSVLEDLRERLNTAANETRTMEVAALRVQYEDQYSQWRWCMANYYQKQRTQLAKFFEERTRVAVWWSEWSSPHDQNETLSEIQTKLLAGLPADLMPSTWGEAARIINNHPKYSPPEGNIDSAINYVENIIINATECRVLSESIMDDFFHNRTVPQEALTEYANKIRNLSEAMDNDF